MNLVQVLANVFWYLGKILKDTPSPFFCSLVGYVSLFTSPQLVVVTLVLWWLTLLSQRGNISYFWLRISSQGQ